MTTKTPKKTFRRKLAIKIESDIQIRKLKRKRKVSAFLSKTSNLIILISATLLITFVFKIVTIIRKSKAKEG